MVFIRLLTAGVHSGVDFQRERRPGEAAASAGEQWEPAGTAGNPPPDRRGQEDPNRAGEHPNPREPAISHLITFILC